MDTAYRTLQNAEAGVFNLAAEKSPTDPVELVR